MRRRMQTAVRARFAVITHETRVDLLQLWDRSTPSPVYADRMHGRLLLIRLTHCRLSLADSSHTPLAQTR